MEHSIEQFSATIREAAAQRRALRIRGGGTKDFYGVRLEGEPLDTRRYSGVVEYEPTELVLTARAGTPLSEIESILAAQGQMLAFEPPHFGPHATFGGCIAAGFSGPRRAYAGAARDFVLGVRMLNADGEDLRFGGQVMKNVAGYDLSRLLAGSFGTLGLILEISIKVLPRPQTEHTRVFEMSEARAIESMNRWAGQPLPVSATCFVDGALYLRLSGAASAVAAAQRRLGGNEVPADAQFWRSIREHSHPFFRRSPMLWRLSLKSTTAPLDLGPTLLEWNGSLRWIAAALDPAPVHAAARKAGGYATLFRAPERSAGAVYLPESLLAITRQLKRAMDPHGIFGPGRLHPEF
ncbi:MAG TPA: glycolate oxidase subunit GlcE [Burkholderiales bacterium]|jgi:glycolate oxidase FAD binding subunit|nr:glycolate oxidase subunit GlcE [Burkholderiales bacterium]